MLQSEVVSETWNPVFDQVFRFSELPELKNIQSQTLVFYIYEYKWYVCIILYTCIYIITIIYIPLLRILLLRTIL